METVSEMESDDSEVQYIGVLEISKKERYFYRIQVC